MAINHDKPGFTQGQSNSMLGSAWSSGLCLSLSAPSFTILPLASTRAMATEIVYRSGMHLYCEYFHAKES
jgi:hypothetical protein